jgi:hypothetical protein
MDFSQEFESGVQPTAAQLEALARATLTTKQPNLAAQTIKVGFVRLQDTGEYGQFQNLLKCKLCDTVRVEFPRYNMSGRFKIVKTVYDVLLDRFTSMELGTLQTTLSEALGISSGSSSSYSTNGGGGSQTSVRTATINGTTNAQGAVSLSETIPSTATILSVSTTGDANAMCIPWLYNSTRWFAKVVDWRNMSLFANKSWSFTVRYVD